MSFAETFSSVGFNSRMQHILAMRLLLCKTHWDERDFGHNTGGHLLNFTSHSFQLHKSSQWLSVQWLIIPWMYLQSENLLAVKLIWEQQEQKHPVNLTAFHLCYLILQQDSQRRILPSEKRLVGALDLDTQGACSNLETSSILNSVIVRRIGIYSFEGNWLASLLVMQNVIVWASVEHNEISNPPAMQIAANILQEVTGSFANDFKAVDCKPW